MGLVFALDVGTTSVSAVAIDAEEHVLASRTASHHAQLTERPAEVAEQELAVLETTARQLLRELQADVGEQPQALGLTGQMHGFVLLDEAHGAVSPLITWQDQRGLQPDAVTGRSALEELQAELPTEISRDLGCRLRTGYAVVTLRALRKRGEWPAGAVRLADITGYLASRLTGEPPGIDPTFAASWGLLNVQTGQWQADCVRAAGLTPNFLPRLLPSGAVQGTVTDAAANSWGLPSGLPVLVGIGDNQASVRGAIQHPERELLLNIGTGGQIVWSHPGRDCTAEIEIRPFGAGACLHVGAGIAGGDAYAWLQRQVQGWLAPFGVLVTEEDIYRVLEQQRQQLEQSAEQTPLELTAAENERLSCEPFFRGTRAEPLRRGMLRGIGNENFSLGHLAEAVLTGIVDSLCELYERAPSQLPRLERVVVAGNFFQHHGWLKTRIAERWQVPVISPRYQEQAAAGAALLALEWTRTQA